MPAAFAPGMSASSLPASNVNGTAAFAPAGGKVRNRARALATTTTSRPVCNAYAASMRRAITSKPAGFFANGKSARSGKRSTLSSPKYAAKLRANVMAASSPATTASVACGLCENLAATKNGRALFATPSVPSSPASSLFQKSSKHPERSSANRSESMSIRCLPHQACYTHASPTTSAHATAGPATRLEL